MCIYIYICIHIDIYIYIHMYIYIYICQVFSPAILIVEEQEHVEGPEDNYPKP